MKLNKLFVHNYKNLKDLKVNFNGQENIDVFIGKNGSGKTNLLNVIFDQFSELKVINIESNKPRKKIKSKLKIKYIHKNNEVGIGYKGLSLSLFSLPGKLIYFRPSFEYNDIFEKRIKKSENIICINQNHLEIIVFTLFFSKLERHINLLKSIGISGFVKCIINPKKNQPIYVSAINARYFEEKRYLITPKDLLEMDNVFAGESGLFTTLNQHNWIKSMDISFLKNNVLSNLNDLSDGEKQKIMIIGIIELFAGYESLILIDEPEAYMHPKWQRELIKEIKDAKSDKDHVLITTHSPFIISDLPKENIHILEDGKILPSDEFSFGRDIATVLYDFMGVTNRQPEIQKEIDELFGLIESESEFTLIKYFELEAKLGSDDPDVIKAKYLVRSQYNIHRILF